MRKGYRPDEDRALNPGLLRHRIIWQRKVSPDPPAQNGFGEPDLDWDDVLACSAQVTSKGAGGEAAAEGQRWATVEYEIVMHYSPGVLSSDRIKWFENGVTRYLDVLSIVDRAGQHRIMDIIARENIANQAAA